MRRLEHKPEFCVLCAFSQRLQLPQLVKPAEKPPRPWRKKAQRQRKRTRQNAE
jgi:hypothetical protein